MPKAFWLFAEHEGDGSEGDPHRAHLPGSFSGRMTCPGDIVRLGDAVVGPNHGHLLVGGIGLPDDNLTGDGASHRHYVVKVGDSWQQVTVGATSHDHELPVGLQGELVPDYYMLFVGCSNADAVDIVADGQCFPIVEAEVTEDAPPGGVGDWVIGALDNTPWSVEDKETWDARVLGVLRTYLPADIDRGRRLVVLFLGALLNSNPGEERGYRYGG